MIYLNIIGVITCAIFVWSYAYSSKTLGVTVFAICLGVNLAWLSLSLFPIPDKCADKPTLTMTRHEL